MKGWPPIVEGRSTLLLAPTASGKTPSAFLVAIDRLLFGPPRDREGVRVLHVSPLEALGVDVERNLRAPLDGMRVIAERAGEEHRVRVAPAAPTPGNPVEGLGSPADEGARGDATSTDRRRGTAVRRVATSCREGLTARSTRPPSRSACAANAGAR